MNTVRLLAVGWWLQLKMRSRSAFEGVLGMLWPLFFATTIFLMYRQTASGSALIGAAVGASAMGVWSATSTTASGALQSERRQGTLELLVAAPVRLPLVVLPIALSMATIGLYSLIATLLWGRLAFGISISVHDPFGFVCAVFAIVVAIALIGFLQAIVMVRHRAAWSVGAALELPVWLLCGFLVPLSELPVWVHPVSWALPPTWGVYALRAAALGGSRWLDIALCLLLGGAYAILGAVLSYRLLDSARKHATLALI